MTRNMKVGIGALATLLLAGVVWYKAKTPNTGGWEIMNEPAIELPTPGAMNKSPLLVAGTAPGAWYFEASFPIGLRTKDGMVLGIAPAHATEDWMTAAPVHFSTTIPFKVTKKTEAILILKKDNPSSLPENDESYEVSVTLVP